MNALAEFHFLRPLWLLLLVPAFALALALARQRGRSGSWRAVIAPELLPYLLEGKGGDEKRRWLLPVLVTGWLLAAVAAAGPTWERLPTPVLQKQDALVVLLDLSLSMWAQDVEPSRIDRAQRKLLDLLDRRDEGQTGLVAFAGDAHVVTPLTDDGPTIANLLPALDPGMMPVPGANPVAAVEQALALLDAGAVGSGRLLLVTDAVSTEDGERIARVLADRDVSLSVLGVGTGTGAPIPLPEGGFLKRDDGSIVIPGLREAPLRALARRGGGRYQRIAVDDSDLERLRALAAPGAGETRTSDRRAERWADMAHWFCLPLVPLLLYAFRRGVLFALAPLALCLGAAPPVQAGPWEDLWYRPDQQGARALAEGEAEIAAERFEDPRWQGTAAYRAGDYATAIERFDDNADADALYNRGNALARAGRLEEAIAAYRQSLELAPAREDARSNLELVQSLRDQQQQQQQQESGNGGEQQESPPEAGDGPEQGSDRPDSENSDGAPDKGSEGGSQAPPAGEPPGEPQQTGEQRDGERDGERDSGAAGNAADSLEQPTPTLDAQQSMAEDIEARQAMQQWLRRVPDDPAGLLREKFRYESRKRQRQGQERRDEQIW